MLDPSEPGPTEKETAWAVIDGYVLPESPDAVLDRGEGLDVPLLTGATTGEGALFAGAPLRAYVDKARALSLQKSILSALCRQPWKAMKLRLWKTLCSGPISLLPQPVVGTSFAESISIK